MYNVQEQCIEDGGWMVHVFKLSLNPTMKKMKMKKGREKTKLKRKKEKEVESGRRRQF